MKRGGFTRIYIAFGLLFFIVTVAITGFMLVEGYSFVQAFYMTIITISTVGFGEVKELSELGQVFTALLIIFSFGIFAYTISTITSYVLDGEIRNQLINYKVNKRIEKLKGHVIVCGYGRNGKQASIELYEHQEKIVIVEGNETVVERIRQKPHLICIHGNAIHEEVLEKAKIKSAKALITTLPSDADNLFVVLTARALNPDMTIISRASEDHSDTKLKRAGATNVIMPDKVGGARMAKLVSQPDVVEFLESIILHDQDEVNLEEISCEDLASENINKSIREFRVRDESGANIIGLKTVSGAYIFNPSPDLKLSYDDKLFVLGTPEQIEKLKTVLATN